MLSFLVPLGVEGLTLFVNDVNITVTWVEVETCDVNGEFLNYQIVYNFTDPLEDVDDEFSKNILLPCPLLLCI